MFERICIAVVLVAWVCLFASLGAHLQLAGEICAGAMVAAALAMLCKWLIADS
jgi:hypothetical protein